METIVKEQFNQIFGHEPKRVYSAPGRVNLIGEHTDYNDGFVLPAAINFCTWIAASKRPDNIIEAVALDELDSEQKPTKTRFEIGSVLEKDSNAPWSDYLRGVVIELLAKGFKLCGANLAIKGNVPRGAGLSSSASLEVAIALTLTQLSEENIDGVTAAKVGQAAENNFAGCQCGIMDQMVSSLGKKDNAVLLDCRSLETELIPIARESSLIVVNSNVKRGLVDSEYNTRRQQCEQAAAHFNVSSLRDVTLQQLQSEKDNMDAVVYKRALHVLTENQRTLDATEALKNSDFKTLSRLMFESHESMKNDFEITVKPIDDLVNIIRNVIGEQGGVRMTGGGFGGCIVALVPLHLQAKVLVAVNNEYNKISGYEPTIFICEASDGAFIPPITPS